MDLRNIAHAQDGNPILRETVERLHGNLARGGEDLRKSETSPGGRKIKSSARTIYGSAGGLRGVVLVSSSSRKALKLDFSKA